MVDWGVVCLLAATVGPIVRYCGLWAATACAAVLQSLPVSCHFRGCKAPLSRIVSGAISSELALPLPFFTTTLLNFPYILSHVQSHSPGRRRGRPPSVGWSYLSINTWSLLPANFSPARAVHQQSPNLNTIYCTIILVDIRGEVPA